MKEMKNQIEIIAITAQIYWTKFQIYCIKQLIKVNNTLQLFPG